jgi:uncharacterized protein YjbI with pentapeptide repeats
MGDGTRENPYTREDVLRLIEENGGKAEGLDLSGKVFEERVDLSGLDLEGIILMDAQFPPRFEGGKLVGAKFDGANLARSELRNANMQYAQFKFLDDKPTLLRGANLRSVLLVSADFRGADLTAALFDGESRPPILAAFLDNTDFRGAHLFLAKFKGCYFYGTKLEGACIRGADIYDAHLEEVNWGNYIIGEENNKEFYFAEHVYRRLKLWYNAAGMYDIAAKFYYREREAGRKGASHLNDRAAGWLSWAVFGHGEGWKRILLWIAGFVLLFALIYFAIGTLTPNTFWNSLYYSAVSFIALGYGSWVKEATGWVKGLGVFETFLGFFMMTLLLVTFVRKWAR